MPRASAGGCEKFRRTLSDTPHNMPTRNTADSLETQTETLVQRCLAIEEDDLTVAATERAQTLLRDLLGVMLGSATTTASSRIARDMVRAVYGAGKATVVGESSGSPTAAAAFANGTIGHGIELDDTHSGASIHPGVVIIPVALAVGETEATDGQALLEAIVAGYECTLRIGRAADPAVLYDRGFHPTATCGVFGAALAAARLKGLDFPTSVHAVGLAGSFAAGNQEYLASGSLSKRIQPGVAAQAGIQAAELAARGYTGPESVLAGENGFLSAYADGGTPDRLDATIDDAYRFEITRTGIKPHACCRYNQTPIDAALQVSRDNDLEPGDVASVRVGVVGPAMGIVAEPRARKIRPSTATDAQFSLQYSVAVALLTGQAFLEQFADPFLTDEAVLAMAERVHVEHDKSLDEHYPDHFPATATVETTAGDTHSTSLETCRGEPSNPLPAAFLKEKFTTLAGRSLEAPAATALWELVGDLRAVDDVGAITAYLRG